MNRRYVQYGCGLSAPKEWINFDKSPSLWLQRIPFLKRFAHAKFPRNVRYGDIIKGLPLKPNSCDGIYCSHVLEHLSYNDFQIALSNTYKILKPGGVFRLVMPDLEFMTKKYLEAIHQNPLASIDFMENSGLGLKNRKKGIKAMAEYMLGNSRHLWLWDAEATTKMVEKAGFKNIRKCTYNDSSDAMFKLVENDGRFFGAVALEMIK